MVDDNTPEIGSAQTERNLGLRAPKTTATEIANAPSNDYGMRQQVTRDAIASARELVPNMTWQDVLSHVKAASKTKGATVFGEGGFLASRIPQRMMMLARELGVGMDSPRMVYLGTYHIAWSVYADLTMQEERVKDIEAGRRQFGTEEARQRALDLAHTEIVKLEEYKARLNGALKDYAEEHHMVPAEQDLLKELLYADTSPKIHERVKRAVQLLKEGKLEEALEIELKDKPDRKK